MRTRRGTLACQGRPHTRGGEGGLQIWGQWAFKRQILAGLGVGQPQSICVQKLAFKAECGTTLPVKRVSNHRMPSRFKVNPYLVCAPGFKTCLDQTQRSQPLNRAEVRDRLAPAGGEHRLARPSTGVASEWPIDAQCRWKFTMNQREVAPFDLAVAHHLSKAPVGSIGTCNQQQPRGIPVKAMHDSRPVRIITARDPRTEERVHEGPLVMTPGRVGDHACRLVHHHNRLVGINDRHVDLLGVQIARRAGRRSEGGDHGLTLGQAVTLGFDHAIHRHLTCINEALRLGAAVEYLALGEHCVEAAANHVAPHHELHHAIVSHRHPTAQARSPAKWPRP